MAFEELQPVVLTHDIPEFDLRAGDIGTVVFVSQDGKTSRSNSCFRRGIRKPSRR